MATNTPNFNLVKPDLTDPVDIVQLNGNTDIIDTELGSLSAAMPPNFSNVAITTPVAGQKLIYDGTNWVNLTGYVYVQTVYFTSSGTGTKATYPWLRAIRVRCQGGGGSGGGSQATGAGQVSGSGGGGGGAYVESFITDIAGLDSSVTVTRGAGGSSAQGDGNTGGLSSFGSLVLANGGAGGTRQGATTTVPNTAAGGQGSQLGTGDITFGGTAGTDAFLQGTGSGARSGGSGGSSHLGGGTASGTTLSGRNYGGGSAGRSNGPNTSASSSGSGGNGIVIIELYA